MAAFLAANVLVVSSDYTSFWYSAVSWEFFIPLVFCIHMFFRLWQCKTLCLVFSRTPRKAYTRLLLGRLLGRRLFEIYVACSCPVHSYWTRTRLEYDLHASFLQEGHFLDSIQTWNANRLLFKSPPLVPVAWALEPCHSKCFCSMLFQDMSCSTQSSTVQHNPDWDA